MMMGRVGAGGGGGFVRLYWKGFIRACLCGVGMGGYGWVWVGGCV